MDSLQVEQKWQKKWAEAKVFDSIPKKGKKKFFLTFPYPYVNGLPHIGHMFTLMRVEAFAKYKRLQGFNVLFPQGWHCTGSPIVSAARRIKENEPGQIKILKDFDVPDKEIPNFASPEYWIKYFPPKYKHDVSLLGMGIDWRREFITTSLNPYYDKFIRWQFLKLKEKGFVIKGKFPVVWDPVINAAVGDHDRKEGEGETPKDFIWVKFKLKNSDLILMAGTTRPDALYGQTNLWLDPKATYKIVEVDNEKWVVGEKAVQKIKDQHAEPKVIGEISAKELIGRWVKGPLIKNEVYILPAEFIDANMGSGVVYSALEDPVDLFELRNLQSDKALQKKYGLDDSVVSKLKPIPIIDVSGMGDDLGADILNEYKIKSKNDKVKLEVAKGELNKRVFRKGIMKDNCGVCKGLSVPDAQELLKKNLAKSNDAIMFYELTGKVVSRNLSECIVKIVDNQWFLDYGNPEWKKLTHECLDQIKLYPEKSRQQFDYVIDWLHEWACTREAGLGTRLPWDEKWLIESLSDSTIYMAFYTISHKIKELSPDELSEEFFDFVFLGKGEAPSKLAKDLRDEFLYWYPVDFRNSGKDLIQNHLTFFMFNHVAIFPKSLWPKGIGANGWVTVDGQKMSKSLGNFIPVRQIVKEYSADAARITILNGGEGLDDPNWDSSFAKAIGAKLNSLEKYYEDYYNKGRSNRLLIDDWFESELNELIQKITSNMEETNFRSAIQLVFFGFQNMLKWYLRRCNNVPNKVLMKAALDAQIVMLSPFCPHICEEVWEKVGNSGFIIDASWPSFDTSKIDSSLNVSEELIRRVSSDIVEVLKLAKIEKPNNILFIVSPKWKYELYDVVAKELEFTRNPSEILKKVMSTPLKQYGKDIAKLIPSLINQNVSSKSSQEVELRALDEAKKYFESEFSAKVIIELAEDSKNAKAKNASPTKPAIVVE